MRTIKLVVDGKEREALVVENIKSKKIRRKKNNKVYEWEEHFIYVYLPKKFVAKRLAIIPLE